MSMYYSPEIVRLLTEERLREAREARRSGTGNGLRLSSRLRLFVLPVRTPARTPAPCAC